MAATTAQRTKPIRELGLLKRDVDAAFVEEKARTLAEEIADAADADQWAISLVGHPRIGKPDFNEMVPRGCLEGLSDGKPGRYRMTLVLQAGGRDLGIIRLGTIRPRGFVESDVSRARAAAACAAEILERLIPVR